MTQPKTYHIRQHPLFSRPSKLRTTHGPPSGGRPAAPDPPALALHARGRGRGRDRHAPRNDRHSTRVYRPLRASHNPRPLDRSGGANSSSRTRERHGSQRRYLSKIRKISSREGRRRIAPWLVLEQAVETSLNLLPPVPFPLSASRHQLVLFASV